MHFVFDTEFELRLVYHGALPALIEDELAVRVVHPAAKSWDTRPFAREQRRFVSLYRPLLTRGERWALDVQRILLATRVYRALSAAGRLKRRLIPAGREAS
jgi:hypothetical protein